MVRSRHYRQFLPADERKQEVVSYVFFSNDLRHHFRFHDNPFTHIGYALHLTDPPTDRRQQVATDHKGIAGEYHIPETGIIDLKEISPVVMRIRYGVQDRSEEHTSDLQS